MGAGKEMSRQFIQMTSGWIPVAVMALLAFALVAGQARANLPHAAKVLPLPSTPTSIEISLQAKKLRTETLRTIESLPAAFQDFLAWPADIELSIDTTVLRQELVDDRAIRGKAK